MLSFVICSQGESNLNVSWGTEIMSSCDIILTDIIFKTILHDGQKLKALHLTIVLPSTDGFEPTVTKG
jgi:hypothetical protein